MMRMKPIADAAAAALYFSKGDTSYYFDKDGLHREWGGKLADRLGLAGEPPTNEQLARLLHGYLPDGSHQPLTARIDDDRLCGWDLTASVPKGVTVAAECGDTRVPDAIWRANRLAMADVEGYAVTRVRVGGEQDDRHTGSLLFYSTEHAETRPVEEKGLPADHPGQFMPDMDRHIHNVVLNCTFDAVENRLKALKIRPIFDLRKFFDRRFDHHLANILSEELGYEVETKWRPNARGDVKYYSWDIVGMPASVIAQNSRRSDAIADTEARIIAGKQADHPDAPDQLSAVARDQLGATSRLHKRDDLTLDACRDFWQGRITDDERDAIQATIARARERGHARPERAVEKAVEFAIRHHGERQSVTRWEQLLITAMERSLGGASPAEIEQEAIRQGVIVRVMEGVKEATTSELQREERMIAGHAQCGIGSVRPVGVAAGLKRGRLNEGQWQAAVGLLESANRVCLVEGPAGTGKSYMLKKFDQGVRLAGGEAFYLAPTSDAVAVLEKDGFAAHTVARFLVDDKLQAAAKGCRLVIDEASLLGHKDAYRLTRLAEKLDFKLIYVGDPMQHGSVPRGALLTVLKDYGQVKPFTLREIRRQEDIEYRAAVASLSVGNTLAGFDAIDHKGWVKNIADSTDRLRHAAADYVQALDEKKTVIAISPTHRDAAKLNEEIRRQLRQAGKLSGEEQAYVRLVAADATEAERGEAIYRRDDVIQFTQNAKGFKKGQRLTVTDPAVVPVGQAGKFQLYRQQEISLAVGDLLRFTATINTRDGRKLRNGDLRTIDAFLPGGDIRLAGGMVVPADAGHFRLGYVDTSFSSQGRTTQRAIVSMSAASLPAVNQEQLYVSASRSKEKLTIYTDDKAAVREAIQRSSRKRAALDLLDQPSPAAAAHAALQRHLGRQRRLSLLGRVRELWQRRPWRPVPQPVLERASHERH